VEFGLIGRKLAYKWHMRGGGADVTGLLIAWSKGDEGARNRLIETCRYDSTARLNVRNSYNLSVAAAVGYPFLNSKSPKRVLMTSVPIQP
jgi:hypothetical protein